jgi:hypothetical protein
MIKTKGWNISIYIKMDYPKEIKSHMELSSPRGKGKAQGEKYI